MSLFGPITVILFCLLGMSSTVRAATLDQVFDQIIQTNPGEEADLRRRLRAGDASDRAMGLALWHERRGEPALAVTSYAAAPGVDAYSLASVAYWSAQAGDTAGARRHLTTLDERQPQGLAGVAAQVALAALQRQEGATAEAETLLHTAAASLSALVRDEAYASWRSSLLSQRIDLQQEGLITTRLGPDLATLRAADLLAGSGATEAASAAYAALAKRDPHGPAGGTARLAGARIALLSGETAWTGDLAKNLGGMAPALQAQGQLLIGDAALAGRGDVAAAGVAYHAALETLRTQDPDPMLGAAQVAAASDGAAHVLNNRGYPAWKRRTPGTVWIPACAPWITSQVRYLALTRLAVATWLGGDHPAAVQLAGSATMFDEVDRAMTSGAGSCVLAAVLGGDDLVLSGAPAVALSARQRPVVALAEVAYLLYDWQECLDLLALAQAKGGSAQGARAIAFLRGRAQMMLGDRPAALASFATAAGEHPDEFWGEVRVATFGLVHQEEQDGPARGDRILEEVRAQLPASSSWAREALLAQGVLWSVRDPVRAARAYAAFTHTYPTWKPELLAQLKAELSNPPEIRR